jgi:hypothetical protein
MSPSNAVFAQRELRKLQTERLTRILQLSDGQVPADLGAASLRAAIGTAIEEQWRRNEEQFEALLEGSSFCKPANAAPAAAQKRTGRGARR